MPEIHGTRASRRPCLPGGRLVLRLPRLFPVDQPGSEIQLPLGPSADRSGATLLHQAFPVRARWRGRDQADASRHHLRQVGELVPQGALSRLQGAPAPTRPMISCRNSR